jgi:hypothetical protein
LQAAAEARPASINSRIAARIQLSRDFCHGCNARIYCRIPAETQPR